MRLKFLLFSVFATIYPWGSIRAGMAVMIIMWLFIVARWALRGFPDQPVWQMLQSPVVRQGRLDQSDKV